MRKRSAGAGDPAGGFRDEERKKRRGRGSGRVEDGQKTGHVQDRGGSGKIENIVS